MALFALGLGSAGTPALAGAQRAEGVVRVPVIEISGLIDPVQADFLRSALASAARQDASLLVVRLDSTGGVLPQTAIDALAFRVSHSRVPVAVWVGPGREARAYGPAFQLLRSAAVSGMSPGSKIGRSPAPVFGSENPLGDRSVGVGEARRAGVVRVEAATLGDFIVALDGQRVGADVLRIPTRVVNREGRPPQRELAANQVQVSFDEPSLLAQTLHAVATPSVTYLLLVLGLLLLVFEYFTAGIGVAAAVGAVCVVLAGYGIGVLPVKAWALGLVGLGVVGYSIDVQAGAPRAWSWIGTVSLVVGSVLLYDEMSVPLPILAVVIAGVALAMVAGMPAMLRTRFATPTIGRESMIGEEGTALAGIDPDGVVQVRSAPWRARTNRATPIAAGDPVRVVGIDGLLLEVEPLEGAARDAGH